MQSDGLLLIKKIKQNKQPKLPRGGKKSGRTGQGTTRQGTTRKGMTRQGKTRQGKARQEQDTKVRRQTGTGMQVQGE